MTTTTPVEDHQIDKFNNNNHNNNVHNNDNNEDDNDNDDVEEHHDLVIQQSMSIGTDDDDNDDDPNDYYSSDDGSSLMGHYNKATTTTSQNGSFLFHSTKFWTLDQPTSPPRPQHLYNYLETTEGFLLNGADRTFTFNNHNNSNNNTGATTRTNHIRQYRSGIISGWKCCIATMLLFILISIIAIWDTARSHGTNDAASSYSFPNNNSNNNTIYILPTIHKFKGAPQYSCPIIISSNNNNNDNNNDTGDGEQAFNSRFANHIDINMIQQDMTAFIDTFRDRNIAEYMNIGWNEYYHNINSNYTNVTYHTLKEQMTAWRTSKYIPSLKKTGANILELNCGLGLNLFMTYEIIQQSQPKDNIRDVHLYGTTTTYSSSSSATATDESIMTAVTANVLLDTILQKEANFVGGGKRGIICPTVVRTDHHNREYDHNNNNNNDDAPDLSFIPDNSFDLVYTSDIPTARDIWDTNTNLLTNQEFVRRQVDLCRTKDTDWKSSILYQVSQEQQEMIYGRHVAEMIRITKPGNVIAIEHVPRPFCDIVSRNAATAAAPYRNDDDYYSGVGLDPSFWYNPDTHERYQWNDLDVTTIDILMDESSYHDEYNNATQYHVVMKKAKK